jgi:hypothetical protein
MVPREITSRCIPVGVKYGFAAAAAGVRKGKKEGGSIWSM